jgi:hypothetical protein
MSPSEIAKYKTSLFLMRDTPQGKYSDSCPVNVLGNIGMRILATEVLHQNQQCVVIDMFLPQREKKRVLFLYNETLKRRIGFFKYMKAKVRKTVREQMLEVCIFHFH